MATADPSFGAVDKQNEFLPMVNGEPGIRRPFTADMRGKCSGDFWSAPNASGVWFAAHKPSMQHGGHCGTDP